MIILYLECFEVGCGWRNKHGSRLLRVVTDVSQLIVTGAVLKLAISFIKIWNTEIVDIVLKKIKNKKQWSTITESMISTYLINVYVWKKDILEMLEVK